MTKKFLSHWFFYSCIFGAISVYAPIPAFGAEKLIADTTPDFRELSANGRHLFFVECNSTGIVIRQANNKNVNITLGELKAASGCPVFEDFIVSAKHKRNYEIVLLVRQSGLESYSKAHAIAERCKARTSKLSIPNDGIIDLSMFNL